MSAPDIVVLISGSGSNLQAFIDAVANGELPATIAAVISNNPDVKGLARAKAAGIPAEVLNHRDFDSRDAFDRCLAEQVAGYRPALVVLAGFMRILSPAFVNRFSGKLMNIHPSLLPKYPGLDTHRRAIEAGDAQSGATVHFVTSELDGGPAIIQAVVPIADSDDPETLAKKVLKLEHRIYPQAARWFVEGRLLQQDNRALLDKQVLPASGFPFGEHLEQTNL